MASWIPSMTGWEDHGRVFINTRRESNSTGEQAFPNVSAGLIAVNDVSLDKFCPLTTQVDIEVAIR